MPIGNLKSWDFASPNLVSTVLRDSDFVGRGYVWGYDGKVYYCFLDPLRYALNIWKKEFWWRSLGWLVFNLIGAFAVSAAGPAAVIAALLAIPTLPSAFLYHYRKTAKAQPAAVETNGPQNEYPGRLTSGQMAALAGGAGGVGFLTGVAAGIQAAAAAAAGTSASWFSVSISVGLFSISGGFLVALVAIGTAVNAAALTIFIAGLLSKPFDLVKSPTIYDPGVGGLGTYYIGRTGQPINTYRIGTDPGRSMTWVCGGCTAMIIDGKTADLIGGSAAATYSDLFLPAPPWPKPDQFVVWGLIPLAATGYSPANHPGDDKPVPWDGPMDPSLWTKGLIVVAGAERWIHAYTQDLVMHHCVQAVATDGHLSPLMGSGDELELETNFALDPIQKYGIECLPE